MISAAESKQLQAKHKEQLRVIKEAEDTELQREADCFLDNIPGVHLPRFLSEVESEIVRAIQWGQSRVTINVGRDFRGKLLTGPAETALKELGYTVIASSYHYKPHHHSSLDGTEYWNYCLDVKWV